MRTVLLLDEEPCIWGAIVAGYLDFYAGKLVDTYCREKSLSGHVHPLVHQVMEEDGISLDPLPVKPMPAKSRRPWDIVIMEKGGTLPPQVKAAKVHEIPYVPIDINVEDDSAVEELRQIREQIKRDLLQFIGRELLSSV